jgi:hypothetical protein
MKLLFLLLTSFASHAYIPEYSLIASHAADQHGKGLYWIEQEVTYRKDAEAFTVKETWLVGGEGALRVTLDGRGPLHGLVQGTIVFDSAQKAFVDPASNTTRAQRLGEDWLETLFHFRSSKYFRHRLVTLKVAPSESLRDRPAWPSEGDIRYEPPSFVRLSRVGGTTAWAIGASPYAGGTAPTLWVEQDQFVVRKYRGADLVVLRADDYIKYDEGFWFPRLRVYNFGPYSVEVQTLRVRSAGKLGPGEKRFKAASLTAKDALRLPDVDALREFYSRFR